MEKGRGKWIIGRWNRDKNVGYGGIGVFGYFRVIGWHRRWARGQDKKEWDRWVGKGHGGVGVDGCLVCKVCCWLLVK